MSIYRADTNRIALIKLFWKIWKYKKTYLKILLIGAGQIQYVPFEKSSELDQRFKYFKPKIEEINCLYICI